MLDTIKETNQQAILEFLSRTSHYSNDNVPPFALEAVIPNITDLASFIWLFCFCF